ncbi:MAG: nicotinate (nicotinamide) nucleotide adenylyltransferase [Ruminococcus sp.]|nr:nicotinate (nicotinamide) nucleotide adenylyltransferase [Ruminococcus sp.]
MRTALFGGAFNPIHIAHTRLAENAMHEFAIDRVVFMPTYKSPHKDTTKSVSYTDRLNMCRLASEDNSGFVVSELESKIKGKSYSYITLGMLKDNYPKDELFLIVGADMYMSLLSWKNPEKIFSLSNIITCPRDEDDYSSLREYSAILEEYNCSSFIMKKPIMELSSTMVRDDFEGCYKRGLIDKKVYNYAVSHGLYGVNNNDF